MSGMPRNPEFINITGRVNVCLSAPLTAAYIRAAERVSIITKTTDPESVSMSRGDIGDRYREEKTSSGIKKSASIFKRVSSDSVTRRPIINPLNMSMNSGSSKIKLFKNITILLRPGLIGESTLPDKFS